MAKPKVISVANQKGGVGKSATAYNLGPVLRCMKESPEAKRALQGDHIKMMDGP